MNAENKIERILVVDDQQAKFQVLGGMLGQLGYEIVPVTSGEQALQRLAAKPADLILLDALMPGMDGFEVARRLREMPALAGVFLIAMTGYASAEDLLAARLAGFDKHLVKPVDLDTLRDCLRRWG